MGFREVVSLVNITQQVGHTVKSRILTSLMPEFMLFLLVSDIQQTHRTPPHILSSHWVRIVGQWA